MGFECLYGPFCQVGAVTVGVGQLIRVAAWRGCKGLPELMHRWDLKCCHLFVDVVVRSIRISSVSSQFRDRFKYFVWQCFLLFGPFE